jgi:hypothetical protein
MAFCVAAHAGIDARSKAKRLGAVLYGNEPVYTLPHTLPLCTLLRSYHVLSSAVCTAALSAVVVRVRCVQRCCTSGLVYTVLSTVLTDTFESVSRGQSSAIVLDRT